jgi:hypothetical protein
MAGGQESTFGQGSLGNSVDARLRSRKDSGSTASTPLSGSQATLSQGAFGKTRTKPLSGSSTSVQAGNLSTGHQSDDADFLARATASGVIAVNNFNDSSELGEDWTVYGCKRCRAGDRYRRQILRERITSSHAQFRVHRQRLRKMGDAVPISFWWLDL